MGFSWLRLRVEVRARWRTMIALVLFIGVVGGVSLAAAAGAHRTVTVVDRLRSASKVYDVKLFSTADPFTTEQWSQIDRLPQVADAAGEVGVVGVRVLDNGSLDARWINSAGVEVAFAGSGYFQQFDRPRVVAGRLPEAPDEAVINQHAVDALGVTVGDRFPIRVFDGNGPGQASNDNGVPGEVRVVGIIETFDDEMMDPADSNLGPLVVVGPSALHRELTPPYELHIYRLHNGTAEVAGFVSAVRGIVGDGNLATQESEAAARRANRSLRPYVLALAVFAMLVLASGLLLIAQAIAREERHHAGDATTLTALGATNRQLLRVTMLRSGLLALGGAVVAVMIAVISSPLMPLGDARSLEPNPGVQIDARVLGFGFLGIVLFVAGVAALSSWSEHRRRSVPSPSTTHPRLLSRSGGSPVGAVGVSFALARPDSRTGASPSRSLVGLVLALTVMTASVVFGANLVRFVGSEARSGWQWDGYVVRIGDEAATVRTVAKLEANPDVGGVVRGEFGDLVVGGKQVPAVGLGNGEPSTSVVITDGRAPIGDDEVVLGRTTLRQLNTHIGDSIDVATEGEPRTMKVVGAGVFPRFSPYPVAEPTGLGIGAAVTIEGLTALGQVGPNNENHFLLVSAARGHTLDATAINAQLSADEGGGTLYGRQRPVEVRGYDQMRSVPLILVIVLGFLLLGALANILVSGARYRRRDLAVLRAMGFTGGQVTRAVIVQVLVIMAIVGVIAVPIGVVVGAASWRYTAVWLGISDDVAHPFGIITAMLVLVVGLGVSIAAIVGSRAAGRSVHASLTPE